MRTMSLCRLHNESWLRLILTSMVLLVSVGMMVPVFAEDRGAELYGEHDQVKQK